MVQASEASSLSDTPTSAEISLLRALGSVVLVMAWVSVVAAWLQT